MMSCARRRSQHRDKDCARAAGRAPEDLDVAIWAPTSIAPDRALVAKLKGLQLTCVMPDNATPERRTLLAGLVFGAAGFATMALASVAMSDAVGLPALLDIVGYNYADRWGARRAGDRRYADGCSCSKRA